MSRAEIQPILEAIPAARQEDARHYGVHPYFTRRPANVVREYLKRYSQPGDTVLDPFGGTGVTAIEAFLLGRHAIQNDLNPFANFIARNIADTHLPSVAPLQQAFARVKDACAERLHAFEQDEAAACEALRTLPLPENIRLPKNSDAELFRDMFTPRQLAGLALLKQAIDREPAGIVHDLLLLAWSASIAKLNKTFLSAKGRAESRGGSSIFSIYRYKVAAKCVELPLWETFHGRYLNVLAAKEEVLRLRDYHQGTSGGATALDSSKDFRVLAYDAGALDEILKPGSVDYIFTDPPYGGFISYLDLSILWNHWLGFPVSDETRNQEAIVGGECDHSEEHYKASLARSIVTALRLLKPDRWCSIVFQHWDTSYFATILETASDCGAELKAAITQTGDVIWSMHKKKNSASVLAGEMILTFYKPAQPSMPRSSVPPTNADPAAVLSEVLDVCLANGTASFTSEALFNRLIIEFWQRRALGCLSLDRREFADQLEQRGWIYDPKTHQWSKHTSAWSHLSEMALFDRPAPNP
jgi:DNA modification methylase